MTKFTKELENRRIPLRSAKDTYYLELSIGLINHPNLRDLLSKG